MRNLFATSAAMLALLLVPALADDQPKDALGVEGKPLLKASLTDAGGPLRYPQSDKPEITSLLVTIQPGGRTALHHHPVVTVVYVLEGEFEVHQAETVRTYKAGDALIEPIDIPMQGFNPGSVPTKLFVVHIGEEGQPNGVAVE